MMKAGVNPIEVLLWSRNKTLAQVEEALQMVRNKRQFDFTKDRGFVLKPKDQNIAKGKCQSRKKLWPPRLALHFRMK